MTMRSGNLVRRLWRRTSLMQRLGFIALMPTLVTATVLVAMLTRHQLATLQQMGQETANAIAVQTAAVSAAPLRAMERRELARIAQAAGELPHVTQVQIRATDGEIVADYQSPGPRDSADSLTVVRDVHKLQLESSATGGSVLVVMSLADAIAAQHASLRNAGVALLLSLFFAGVIGWQAARWLSAPLRRLVGAVQQLGHGDRRVEVEISDHTEIGQLQRGFNSAAQKLFDMRRGLEQKVERATLELAHKNVALEAASEAKSHFFAAASHDLRQPLYALTLFSSALAADESDPARLSHIEHIQECVQALDHLFNELLDLSRLETCATQLEISEFPLDTVLDEVSRNFRMTAEQHGLRLQVRATDLWVRSDRTMLTRILNNLLSNALRYTREGGVLVGARKRDNGTVRVDVWDTGIGIAPEHQQRIFDEFYRVQGAADREPEERMRRRLGLGLATVQRLSALLNTHVQVKSRPERGSIFSFKLPQAPARTLATPVLETPLDVSGMRVLVIDDEPAILSGIRLLLASWGCHVVTAEDRAQALEAASAWSTPPDIVISDLRLAAGESGLDVLSALDHHYANGRGTPFPRVLITGETRGDRLRETLAAKIPVLFKPVSPEKLRVAMMAARTAPPRTT